MGLLRNLVKLPLLRGANLKVSKPYSLTLSIRKPRTLSSLFQAKKPMKKS